MDKKDTIDILTNQISIITRQLPLSGDLTNQSYCVWSEATRTLMIALDWYITHYSSGTDQTEILRDIYDWAMSSWRSFSELQDAGEYDCLDPMFGRWCNELFHPSHAAHKYLHSVWQAAREERIAA